MYDLVVIGAGSGGLHAARAAAKVGARVALIEKRKPGDVGSIPTWLPSKGLVQVAKLAQQVRRAARVGVGSGTAPVDFTAVMSHLRNVFADFAGGESDEAFKAAGIDAYRGSAAFEAYDTVQVDQSTRISGHRFVIATGSRPADPAIPGVADAACLDDHSVWSLTKLPESLIVIGSEPRALEFAQCFARLGTKVTLVTESPRILPHEDPEASELITRVLTAEGLAIRAGADVTKVEVRGEQKVCRLRDTATGSTGETAAAAILLAAGRLANVELLNLEAVGIHGDAQHGIEVDDYLQTHSTRIYAIGDVLLRHPYAHVAEREAEIVFQNAVLRIRKRMDYTRMPRATFIDPEVAAVGINEEQARALERPARVFRVAFAEIDRARIDGLTDGFAKVVTTPSGKILGATVVGEDAAMILAELVLAMERNLSLGDLTAAVSIYPTYAGVVRQLANQHRATRLESSYVQTALKLFYGFLPRVDSRNGTAEPEKPPPPQESHPAAAHGHGH
jgi:pyruvate/2-oxoglutarate dehydrogenase complex dihydrolipoamide dehydrogenase (E3) component